MAKHRIDVLYNPKYSLPLRAGCPAAWVCHGLDWYVMPWASRRIDRLSHKFLVPRYARKADAIIAVSNITREHVIEYLPIPPQRVITVYSGVDDSFRLTLSAEERARLRERYDLPGRYFLYSGAIYPPKNFTRLVQAYAKVGPGERHPSRDRGRREPLPLGARAQGSARRSVSGTGSGGSAGSSPRSCRAVPDGRRAAAALAVRVVRLADRRGHGVRLSRAHLQPLRDSARLRAMRRSSSIPNRSMRSRPACGGSSSSRLCALG